ncbi:hypothetical protein AWB78_07156 [Caballeronia calidae]|uniref:Phage baseplate protein n=1 Tax=Caballeronia calidae TaxID=1777139 RepID=A0A158EDB4_9BURK|nr:hypothetical protein [Caballeronia calidae]SAL04838.1 hypothetical protein AWB78_07156 [Caballeronia calidae]
MAPITEAQTVGLIERGATLAPLDRAVRLVAVLAGITPVEASNWPLDERDRALIEGRRAMFGPALPFVAHCRVCGEAMEGALDCDALLTLTGDPDAQVRAPSSRDLAEAARNDNPALLAAFCTSDLALAPEELEARLERACPLLDVRLELECEACGGTITERFDIACYFWQELERRAGQVLDEVHALARAYGWTEGEVLALSPARRRAYLDRIAA